MPRGKHAARELGDFLKQDNEERKGLLEMSADQQLDVQLFCRQVSRLSVDVEVYVEDEAEIVVGDFATCKVTLTRTNLKVRRRRRRKRGNKRFLLSSPLRAPLLGTSASLAVSP